MKKILIIGGNGSGKTTFANELSERTKLPVVHLDKLYWKDNWEHCTPEEFDALLMPELRKEKWIIDGNMKRTLPLRLKYCDTVIVFDFSRFRCLLGAIERSVKNYGKSRDDMGGYCPERFSLNFYKSIIKGTKTMMSTFYEMVANEKDVNVMVFRSRKEVKNFMKSIDKEFKV